MTHYRAIQGARFTDKTAAIIGAELEKLGPSCTAETVLAEAKKKRSPLNPFFNWDDSHAAHLYRLEQARYYIRHIEVIIETSDGEQRTRGWHHVTIDTEDPSGAYMQTMEIRKDKTMGDQVIRTALRELQGWQKRYAEYEDLFGEVFVAVRRVTQKVKGRKRRVKAVA